MKFIKSPASWLAAAGLAALVVLAALLAPGGVHSRADVAQRTVSPRGPLAADEQAHVEIFKRNSPSVVHITSLGAQRELFSMNVQQVPRGTGTGFVWDERGHIVTNFHVIQGANGARVTLADQSTFDAQLVGAFADSPHAMSSASISKACSCPRSGSPSPSAPASPNSAAPRATNPTTTS
jgi:S1-C subfamily serine protease